MASPAMVVRIAADLAALRAALAEGKNEIVTTTAAMTRLSTSLQGDRLIQAAHNIVGAVQQVGGAAKLTEAEKARLNTTLSKAIEKYKLLGKEAPRAMLELRDATKAVGPALTQADGLLGKIWSGLKSAAGLAGIAFSVHAITGFVGRVFDAAGAIHDTALKLGVSAEAAQRFKFAAEQTGASLDDVGRALNFMNRSLSAGEKSTVAALSKVGLQFSQIRAMQPEQAFTTIADAIRQIADPMLQADIATQLFSRSALSLLPAIKEGFINLGAQTAVMSNDTIERLDAAGDTWESLWNRVVVATGGGLSTTLRIYDEATKSWSNFFEFVSTFGVKTYLNIEQAAQKAVATQVQAAAVVRAAALKAAIPVGLAPAEIDTAKVEANLARIAAAQKKGAEAATRHAEALATLSDKLSGGGAITQARQYMTALQQSVPIQQMTRAAQLDINRVVTEAIAVYHALGQQAPRDMEMVAMATRAALGQMHPDLVKTRAMLADVFAGFSLEQAKPLITGIKNIGLEITGQGVKLQGVMSKTFDFGSILKKSFGSIKEFGGGLANTIMGAIKGGGSVVNAAAGFVGSGIGTSIAGSVGESLKGASGFWGGKIGQSLGGAFTSILPGVGALLGPLIGKIGGFFSGLFGGVSKEVKEAREGIDAFQAKLAGTLDATQRLEAGGVQWKTTTIAVRDAYLAVGRTAAEADVIVKQLWDDKNPARSKAAIDEINKVLAQQQGQTERLQSAMEKYGFTWEDLGEKARAQKLSDMATELLADFAALTKAGLDHTLVTEKMSGAVNDFVASALRTGTEIPASMRPMLERMIEMGLLTDATGAKLNTLEGLTFAETLTQGFDRVVGKLDELIEKLKGGVGGAIEDLGKRDVTVPIKFKFNTDDLPNDLGGRFAEVSGAAVGGIVAARKIIPFQRFAAGGMASTDTVPALLTPGEMVLNAAQQKHVAGAMGGVSIANITIHASGSFADSPQGRRDLARIVADEIMQQQRRAQRLNVA